MKKFLLTLLMALGCFGCLRAQTLAGKVADRSTGEPIAFASVFLDGTSIYALTDEQGQFSLTTDKFINTNLIVGHVNYHMVSIPNPFDEDAIPDTIFLTEKENLIAEVVVLPDNYTREQKLKVFRQHFLGNTLSGASCKILNEDDIELYFNRNTNQLVASAEHPIIIKNGYLGYEITYRLVDFYVTAPFYSTRFGSPQQTLSLGVTSFRDLAPGNRKFKKRRDTIYKMSSIAFFKALSTGSLKESGFMIFSNKIPVDPARFFSTSDTLSMKRVSLLPDAEWYLDPKLEDIEGLKGVIAILYDKTEQSGLVLLTDSFLVDEFGNTDKINELLFTGSIGSQRIGGMLPLEYELDRPQ